jgi:acyl carrier protein
VSTTQHGPAEAEIRDWLAVRIADYVGAEPGHIAMDRDFSEYGLESVSAFIMCGDIEAHLGLVVEPTAAWDHPTVEALAAFLRAELSRTESAA